MKMFVGVTDSEWFNILKSMQCDEVNFWIPSAKSFKVLKSNELFLFKLHSPNNYIVGGGYFVNYSILPTFLAWEAFGVKNGTDSLENLNRAVLKYKRRSNIRKPDLQIGCIILTEPFFFDRENWIPVPDNWKNNIVSGKTYTTDEEDGRKLFQQLQNKLHLQYLSELSEPSVVCEDSTERYRDSVIKHRLGQGAFRILVANAYQRRCAITGEKTLPVLQAAHIKPYSRNGMHEVSNGLLLRSDIHTLYDAGYITIDTDYRIEVSSHLHEDYGNGRDYYKYDGQKLLILPNHDYEMPSKSMLKWHNENVFRG